MNKPKEDIETNVRMAQNALRQMIRYLHAQGTSRAQVLSAVNAIMDQLERKAS